MIKMSEVLVEELKQEIGRENLDIILYEPNVEYETDYIRIISGTIYNFEIQRIQNFANKYNALMFITTEDNKVLIVLHDFIQTL